VSVPEQAVVSHELVLKGIESAEKNQVTLINAYADDQIEHVKKIMSTVVLDQVLKKQLKDRQTLPADEIKRLILEYAEDLNKQISKIETQRRDLLNVANEGYGELISLSKSNLNLTRSLSKATEEQEQLLGNYKQKLQNVEGALKLFIKP
jgi:hypothetical protein